MSVDDLLQDDIKNPKPALKFEIELTNRLEEALIAQNVPEDQSKIADV